MNCRQIILIPFAMPFCSCLVTMVVLRNVPLGRLSLTPSSHKLSAGLKFLTFCSSLSCIWILNSEYLWYYSVLSELIYFVWTIVMWLLVLW
jgi:hypothetical protein